MFCYKALVFVADRFSRCPAGVYVRAYPIHLVLLSGTADTLTTLALHARGDLYRLVTKVS